MSNTLIEVHPLRTLAVKQAIIFTADEIEAAMTEYRERHSYITSVERNGVFLGWTQEEAGMVWLSAYANRFWITLMPLNADGTATFRQIGIAECFLQAMGTVHEDEAREITHQLSRAAIDTEGPYYRLGLDKRTDAFRAKVRAAGLTNVTTKVLNSHNAS